jgi:hypothetical protein
LGEAFSLRGLRPRSWSVGTLSARASSTTTGSHLRVTTQQQGEHHVTIPNHKALRVRTLAGILDDVAQHFKLDRAALIQQLFGPR